MSCTQSKRQTTKTDLPLEVIDEIVQHNHADAPALKSSSLVSKSWRAASLRYLFSYADFSSPEDLLRWKNIGSSLPHIIRFVRAARFSPGARLKDMELKILDNQFPPSLPQSEKRLAAIERILSHPSRNTSNPVNIPLPRMPQVTVFVWSTSQTRPIHCTPETQQLISAFTSVERLVFSGSFINVAHAKAFLGLFPPLRTFQVNRIEISRRSSSSDSDPPFVFTGDLTKLEELIIEKALTPLDWLVHEVLAISQLTNLRKIRYSDASIFSIEALACLLSLSAGSLEVLCIPACAGSEFPTFTTPPFIELVSLTLSIELETQTLLLDLQLCKNALEILPSAPKLTEFVIQLNAYSSEDITIIMKESTFDWAHFAETALWRFPTLKRFVFRVSMDKEFNPTEKDAIGMSVAKALLGTLGQRLDIEWIESYGRKEGWKLH
ncbi:uncharacterized protein BT62DRAFT_1003187 [Guyanagaster necrorhizus]|uniref:F-box domain-containing protein n=1 Tax=Guyanagaster necrorhizus TaxID=856835 RepID=A0A9P8AUH1_9AGAR|nr:uncharacterized protein BT62DRAFT_1003187 [Guyanagaster necrorhizus MCA 3950]KAG7448473.1 hypothetical protein BT62DRAFT_1003187 [Guyanagaster necrorhizus MCA 3950]